METWTRAQNTVGYAIHKAKQFKVRSKTSYNAMADKLTEGLGFIHETLDDETKDSVAPMAEQILKGFQILRRFCAFADEDNENLGEQGELAEVYLLTLIQEWGLHDLETIKEFIRENVLPAVLTWSIGVIEHIELWETPEEPSKREQSMGEEVCEEVKHGTHNG